MTPLQRFAYLLGWFAVALLWLHFEPLTERSPFSGHPYLASLFFSLCLCTSRWLIGTEKS